MEETIFLCRLHTWSWGGCAGNDTNIAPQAYCSYESALNTLNAAAKRMLADIWTDKGPNHKQAFDGTNATQILLENSNGEAAELYITQATLHTSQL